MGLIIAVVILPMMKVDPEEMKKMQEEMKDSPFAGLLGGAAPASQPQQSISAAGPSKKKR